MPEGEARFYAGCVALGLEHMHSRGVAWRDLKVAGGGWARAGEAVHSTHAAGVA